MPNEKLKERNVEHVLRTAYELFLAYGIENTTKAMLVKASGISRSSVDRYFPSKIDCVLETAKWVGINVRDKNPKINSCFINQTKTGLEALQTYMETIRDLMYKKPELFVLGAECRAFIYRNCTDIEAAVQKLHQALGSSKILMKIFERGIGDGSMKDDINASYEAVLTRESLLGFLTSIALTHSSSIIEDRQLVDSFINRILRLYLNNDNENDK